MQLTEERLKALRQHADEMAAHGWKDDAETIYALLAAHSAGAQEPVAWRYRTPIGWHATPKIDKALRDVDGHDLQPLYTHPQPMPITDAARDAKRYQWLREQHEMQVTFDDSECFIVRSPAESAWTVFRPGRTTSLEPVGCFPGELDKAIDAEIERLDRAKGE